MSIVERALKKIRDDSRPESADEPVARTVVNRVRRSATKDEGLATDCRFVDASSRTIDIDMAAIAGAGLLAPGNQRLMDEYRAIKQPILRKAGEKTPDAAGIDRLIMVASSLSNEGKTFTSVNLCLSLARERDWSVLLVDADCRNPSLSRLLGLDDQPGLLDYLRSDDEDLGSFVFSTNIERLYVLPLGKADPHAAELLGSDRMRAACAGLAAGEFGRLITVFDTSPLLLTPESVIMGHHAGQIVLVVEANRTSRGAVAEALSKLDPVKAIGLLLNRASSDDRLTSYASGYSYGGYGPYKGATDPVGPE